MFLWKTKQIPNPTKEWKYMFPQGKSVKDKKLLNAFFSHVHKYL